MSTAWDAATEAAAALTAAGLRATTDPDDAHPPAVYVTPVEVVPMAGAGCLAVVLAASMRVGGFDHAQVAWLWREAVPTLLAVLGAESVSTDVDLDGLPVITATIERQTTP